MTAKILVSAPAWLGDMVMAQSLLRVLHARGATLDVLAPEWNFAVLKRMPEVNEAIKMPLDHGELKLKTRWQIALELKKNKYDQVIILQNSLKSALIPFFAGIPRRTGYAREMRYGLVNDIRHLDKHQYPLMVQRYVALGYDKHEKWDINDFPHPKLKVNPDNLPAQCAPFNITYPLTQRALALAPGAAFGETKRWPPEYFAEVARQYLDQGWQVWIMGSIKDAPVTREINQLTQNRCIDLAGQLNLDATVDLISLASLMISNDSGLLHVAAALEVPLVGIYGSTSSDFTPPLGKTAITVHVSNLACRPCFKPICEYGHMKCQKDLLPAQVFAAISKIT